MTWHVQAPGPVWKQVTDAYIGVAGVWKRITGAWIGVGGAWKKFFEYTYNFFVDDIGDIEGTPTDASASLSIRTDGTIITTGNACNASANWYTPTTGGIGNTHWVSLDKLSGSDPTSGDSLGLVLPLTSNRTWTWTRTTIGTITGTFQLRIWGDALGTVLLGIDNFTVVVEEA